MSQVIDRQPEGAADPLQPETAAPRASSRGRSVLIWGVVGGLLLVGSGMIRTAQSIYYEEIVDRNVDPPFPLKQIPKTLDGWHLVEGSEATLDPLTTRITGSTDHVLGNYINDETGVTLSVLLLYGPAEPVLPHIPEVCYPATGFKMVGAAAERDLAMAGLKPAKFRSVVFAKSGGRNVLQKTVYYSFRHDGNWIPWVDTRNSPRKNPGIFKIQIDRLMASGEARFQDEPIEGFAKKILPVLETMIADAKPSPSSVPVAQK